MKLPAHAFSRLWELHAWAGVLGGLLLYVMFLTGAITLFQKELAVWEEPLLQRAAPSGASSLERAVSLGFARLSPNDEEAWLTPPAAGRAVSKLVYKDARTEQWHAAWLDPARGEVVPERERLSSFLYELHFLWHDLTGDWLYRVAGFLAALLLLASVTGVLIQLKDLARQFHQFRPRRSQRVLFSDLHKVLGVMGLPFQLLYAYTGALIVLGPLVLQAFVGPVFGGDRERGNRATLAVAPASDRKAGAASDGLSLDDLLARTLGRAPWLAVEVLKLSHRGHAGGSVEVWGETPEAPRAHAVVRVGARDGTVEHVHRPKTAAGGVQRFVYGLHFASFGGPPLRFMFFGLGVATAATILTGNFIWLARREARRTSPANQLLARLTTGIGAGTLVGVAGLFLSSRSLPLELRGRGGVEELVFAGLVAGSTVHAFVTPAERASWCRSLALAALLLLPTPVLAARWSSAGLFGSGPALPQVLGVDLALLVAGLGFGASAVALRRRAA